MLKIIKRNYPEYCLLCLEGEKLHKLVAFDDDGMYTKGVIA